MRLFCIMRIAIDITFLKYVYNEEESYALFFLKNLLQQFPSHEYIFLSEENLELPEYIKAAGRLFLIKPGNSSAIGHLLWYNTKVPAVLKKEQVQLFFALNGFCAATKVPQILLVESVQALAEDKVLKKDAFHNADDLRKNAGKATHIITVSSFCKQQLADKLQIATEKITVVPQLPTDAFVPVEWTTKENMKVQYAGGCEYFLFTGTLYSNRQIGKLLRAFSVFKKWQHSSMKLLLMGDIPDVHEEELDNLDNYKYKDDVITPELLYPETFSKLVASAYAVIRPSKYEDAALELLEAMACEVPVLTSDIPVFKEYGEEAVLYAEAQDFQQLGDNMIRIYKDENFRSQLIAKGSQRLKHLRRQAFEPLVSQIISHSA